MTAPLTQTHVPSFPTHAWWQAKTAKPPRAEVAIANTRRIDFTSKITGRAYSLSIAMPWAPPPPGGYSALYVLESYAYFASAVEASRLNVLMPGVVVGSVSVIGPPLGHGPAVRSVCSALQCIHAHGLRVGGDSLRSFKKDRLIVARWHG